MRRIRSLHVVGGSLIVALACSDHDSTPRPEGNSDAGAAGEVSGHGGTHASEGGAAGRWWDGAGEAGESDDLPTHAGAAGSAAGEAGAPFAPGGAGGEAGAGAGETSGEGGASAGGGPDLPGAAGAAGAAPSRVTAEQRALCEAICAKQPLTNGFAGAPTVSCPNNEGCFEWYCDFVDLVGDVSDFCVESFTEALACYASMPDESFECSSTGLFLAEGCVEADAKWLAACQ